MSEVLFDIVFKGKFSRDVEKEKAIVNFSKLFKIPEAKAAKFFDGKSRTLKKSLNLEKASNFRAALKKAGIRVSLHKLTQSNDESITLAAAGAILTNKPYTQPEIFNTSQFKLDEVGAQIINFKPIEKPEFNLIDFKIDKVGAILANKQEMPKPDIDTSDLSMDEVGAIFAKKKHIDKPDLDISEISMGQVGVTIVEKKKIPKPDINIDRIKFAD